MSVGGINGPEQPRQKVPWSIYLDVRRADDLGPFLRGLGEELGVVGRRSGERRAAQIGEPLLHLGIAENRIDLVVELVDDLGRRVFRGAAAVDGGRLTGTYSATVGTSGSAGERI